MSLTQVIEANGQHFQISTSKHSGVVICTAYKCQPSRDGQAVTIDLFGGWKKTLAKEHASRITESMIEKTHARGIAEFKRMEANNELPQEKTEGVVQVGTILWTEGPWSKRERVVYEITNDSWGTNYKTVEIEAPHELHVDQRIRHIDEKFGIGTYHNAEIFAEMDKLPAMVEAGKAHKAEQARLKDEAEQAAKAEREAKRAKGKAIIEEHLKGATMPAYAIIGALYSTKSNMDDTFDTTCHDHVLLGWSNHKANRVEELVAAAQNFEPTKHLSADDRDTETYSNQVFIGSKWHGWKVQKADTRDANYIYEIAAMNFAVPEYVAPSQTSEAEPNEQGVRIVHNESKRGIEIHFAGKPSEAILSDVKSAGFRWSRFNKCWYAFVNDRTKAMASKYGTLPASLNEETQEDAHDNFLIDQAANNIGA